jgi:hypothetical protein
MEQYNYYTTIDKLISLRPKLELFKVSTHICINCYEEQVLADKEVRCIGCDTQMEKLNE